MIPRLPRCFLNLASAIVLFAVGSLSAAPPQGYRETALPFVEQHYLRCHGPKKTLAGFRIDLIGSDFSKPRIAEQGHPVLKDRLQSRRMTHAT